MLCWESHVREAELAQVQDFSRRNIKEKLEYIGGKGKTRKNGEKDDEIW